MNQLELIGESVWNTYFRIGKLIEEKTWRLKGGGTLTKQPAEIRSRGAGDTEGSRTTGVMVQQGKKTKYTSGRGSAKPGAKPKQVVRATAKEGEPGSTTKDVTPK
jgi:hypothetical protein